VLWFLLVVVVLLYTIGRISYCDHRRCNVNLSILYINLYTSIDRIVFTVVPAGNAAKYARNFIPSYSLFIPLQNVTAEMGATGICPGSHMCAEGCSDYCVDTGFQVSGVDNNWPLGYGALINQQTTHRGSAHVDPHGMDRVVFILTFAPRPQTLPTTVETRLIGLAGSYSLHWAQWGHTLSDYQQPLQRMQQPWRTLRSLGIYNRRQHWGWDYITICSGRISNEDTGFTNGDLEEFLNDGGISWIPKRLQGNGTMDDDTTETTYEIVSFLQDTISKCKEATYQLYIGGVFVYLGYLLILAPMIRKQQKHRFRYVANGIFRLISLHVAVLSVAWLVHRRIVDSTWGRNIRAHRSFSISNSSIPLAPALPATLPTANDILILEGMQSEAFRSYTRVLEVFHPGNKAWNDLVNHFAPCYDKMSLELQDAIRRRMLQVAQQDYRRILIQNDQSNWATAPPKLSHIFCHKGLLQRNNHFVNYAIQRLDYLLSESRYGYWRDTTLHRKHIAMFILNLRNRVMKVHESTTTLLALQKGSNVAKSKRSLTYRIRSLVSKKSTIVLERRSSGSNGIPPDIPVQEPFPGAWLQEGDVAEAAYEDYADGMYLVENYFVLVECCTLCSIGT
jgi:hypothetical protein